jgi:hypothetical protein
MAPKVAAEDQDESTRTHYLFRRIYFISAGIVAGIVLSGVALQNWEVQWGVIAVVSAAGITAGALDVLMYEKAHWSGVSAVLFWAMGFVLIATIMAVALLVPYGILAGVSKVFGIWEQWELVGQPWRSLPILIGGGFGYLFWRLLDDY